MSTHLHPHSFRKVTDPQFKSAGFPTVQTVLLLREEQVGGDVTPQFFSNTKLLSVPILNL